MEEKRSKTKEKGKKAGVKETEGGKKKCGKD